MTIAETQPPSHTMDVERPPRRRFIERPMTQLVLARLREFFRQPEAVFWVYIFPILMVVGLGIAFRNQPAEHVFVDVESGPQSAAIVKALLQTHDFKSRRAIRTNADCACALGSRNWWSRQPVPPSPININSIRRALKTSSRESVNNALQKAAGRVDPIKSSEKEFSEPGGRYVDFLVPGLLGMSLMGGGLWGVGFVTVDMRIRKLLKRFLATPMKKGDFLAAIMLSRMLFMVPEVLVLLLFARFVFHVYYYGSYATLILLIVLGATMFSGIGLLVASRAKTVEAVSGLMNVVMLPMWMLSGIFFSSDRFPAAAQPLIQILPLTPLINALRSVMLEGSSLASQGGQIAIMAAWSVVSFAVALRVFRWQ